MHATLSRRQLLWGASASAALTAAQPLRVWAQAAPAGTKRADAGRLVVVMLRGAYDGISALVPYSDAHYYSSRPNIAIAAPDGSGQTALKLDNTFALHPALGPLLPLWQQGVLSVVPAAGLPAPNRSHFSAQYEMEIAQGGKSSATSGWLNKLAGIERAGNSASAMGVGEANPAILAGEAAVRLIARGQSAERKGVLANENTRRALMDLYAGQDALSEAFRQGASSRMQSAQELSSEKMATENRRDAAMRDTPRNMNNKLDRDGTPASAQAQAEQMAAASNGAADPVGLQLDAQHLGTLMRNDRALRLGFLSAGGWDTHANQGHVTGQLANSLGNLGRGIAQLRQDFSEPGDVIVVMREFGRTARENGTRGTDHGFGNALWLVGNRINGGRWHGQWSGLALGNLNEARDLPAHHDYRAVLAQVLRATFFMPDSALASVLPGAKWDTQLDGLIRKG